MPSFNSEASLHISADCSCESSAPTTVQSTTVQCEDRWQVYHRLQELDISCQCGGFKPLRVEVKTATEALQLWSIVKRVSSSQQNLRDALACSWRLPCKQTHH